MGTSSMMPTEHEMHLGIFNYEIKHHCTSASPSDYVVIPSEAIFFGATQPEKAEYPFGVIRQ